MRNNRINILLVVSIALTLASGVITHYAIQDSTERVDVVVKTQQILRQSADLVSFVKQIESQYHDYLLTHERKYIDRLDSVQHLASHKIAGLQLLSEHPQQDELLLNKIAPLINHRINTLEQSANLATNGPDTQATKNTSPLNTSTDSIEMYVAQFDNRAETLLKSRLEFLQRSMETQTKVRYVSFLLIGLTSLLALISLMKKQKLNNALIEALNITNTNLESSVQERTQELERKSQLTEQLNEELQENFKTLELFYQALQIKKSKAEDTVREIDFLYDNATCGYHSLAIDGSIVRMNKTELEWLGYERHEIIDVLKFADVLIEDEQEIFWEKFNAFPHRRFIEEYEIPFASERWIGVSHFTKLTAIYNEQGQFIRSRATVVDVTEQEESAAQLMLANKTLTALNEEKNHFLGMAAHDLKSPLNGILGLINLLKKDFSQLTIQQQEYLRYIEKSCTAMKVMVTNLLDINRIEQGFNDPEPVAFTLSEVLEAEINLLEENAERKSIRIVLENNNANIVVVSDINSFTRIVDNLLSNAIKFSPPEKIVWVRVSHHEDHFSIDFIDQGPGIKAEEMEKLFGKFKKLSNKPTGGETSTGLGLSIVKQLTTQLKGKISVSSEYGHGCTFTVEFPYSLLPEENLEYVKNSE